MSIEQRLERWGNYMQSARDFGLGFPKRTVLHRCMVEGPAAGAPTGQRDEPVPAEIEETETETETETGMTTETETGTTTETETGATTGTETGTATGTEPAPAEGTATPTQTA